MYRYIEIQVKEIQKYNWQKYRYANYWNKEIHITEVQKYKLKTSRNTSENYGWGDKQTDRGQTDRQGSPDCRADTGFAGSVKHHNRMKSFVIHYQNWNTHHRCHYGGTNCFVL